VSCVSPFSVFNAGGTRATRFTNTTGQRAKGSLDRGYRAVLSQFRAHFIGTKKKGAQGPLLVSPFKLILLTARYFSACGLNVVGGERTRPVFVETVAAPTGQPGTVWEKRPG
jgi:hypothetical protein